MDPHRRISPSPEIYFRPRQRVPVPVAAAVPMAIPVGAIPVSVAPPFRIPSVQENRPSISGRHRRVEFNVGPVFPAPASNQPIYGERVPAPPFVRFGPYVDGPGLRPVGVPLPPIQRSRLDQVESHTAQITSLVDSLAHNLRIRLAYLVRIFRCIMFLYFQSSVFVFRNTSRSVVRMASIPIICSLPKLSLVLSSVCVDSMIIIMIS